MKTIVIGRYGIRQVDANQVWITVLEGENAGEGGMFRLGELNRAVFPPVGNIDIFAAAESLGADSIHLHPAVDRFYRENF